MSDRTQTLSVELDWDVADSLLNGSALDLGFHHAKVALRKAIRAGLSQPEHQGDGHRIEIRWDGDHGMPPVLLLRHPETGCDPGEGATEGCWLDGWLENADEPEGMLRGTVTVPVTYELDGDQPVFYLQPPAPVLSDEERERLDRIARMLEIGAENGKLGAEWVEHNAAFLRTLASQEHTDSERAYAIMEIEGDDAYDAVLATLKRYSSFASLDGKNAWAAPLIVQEVLKAVAGALSSQGHWGEKGRLAKLEALEPDWDSYGGEVPTEKALTAALRNALDAARLDHDPDEFATLAQAFEAALHRLVAAQPCPNYGEATESCDCLICRTQTVLTEWEDELAGELKERDHGE